MLQACSWCGERVEGELLLQHILSRHAPKPGSSKESESDQVSVGNDAITGNTQTCSKCQKTFKHRRSLLRHLRESHVTQQRPCKKCGRTFKNRRTLRNHVKVNPNCFKKKFKCRQCKRSFPSLREKYEHRREHLSRRDMFVCEGCQRKCGSRSTLLSHRQGCAALRVKRRRNDACRRPVNTGEAHANRVQWETQQAMDGLARIHQLNVTDEYDLQLTLIRNHMDIKQRLLDDLVDLRRLKWYMVAWVWVRHSIDGEEKGETRYLRCPVQTALVKDQLEAQVRAGIQGVFSSFDKATGEGSLILFERVQKIELYVAKVELLKGSSYLALPKWLQNSRKGLINIKNDDDKCFVYSVLAGVSLPPSHPERVTHYVGREGELDMAGISCPVKVKSISKFESQNPTISVSVYGVEEKNIVPLRVTREHHRQHRVNLLLIKENNDDEFDDEDVSTECHYVLIKDLSGLLSHTHGRNKRQWWCDNCLNHFDTFDILAAHQVKCVEQDAQAVMMPSPDDCIMKFKEYEKQMWHDYVIYCDLESVLEPIHGAPPDPETSNTTRRSRHVPSGYCYIVVGPDGYQAPVLESGGEDLMLRFLLRLRAEAETIDKARGPSYAIDMTEEDEAAFDAAEECYLCKKKFAETKSVKCRDHAHDLEAKNYLGAACQVCNLNRKRSKFIPVFFHNLAGYDAHHIISALGEVSDGDDISCIPKTKEKYISFQWGKLRFLDSLNFLSSSLDKLVSDLKPEELGALDLFFPQPEKRRLVARKGVYPYAYFDSFERFAEKTLPPPEAFTSDLSGESITAQDYEHACEIFSVFNMDSLQDYHDLYLFCDTLLLSCVMETYRKVAFNHFRLDPVHYYTTPGLSWSAALLYTQQELELMTDLDMHLMWEAGIRGGVSSINCRSATANNPYVPETYDEKQERRYIIYVDANNLYGLGLSRPLPVGGFRFLTGADIRKLDVTKINIDDEDGYLFEVSLEYGKHLHDQHNDFCLAPEKYVPLYEDLSPLQKRMSRLYNHKCLGNVEKLIPNLRDKKNYVVYGTTLKLYVELGLKIKMVHRVMTFKQKAWLAPYIQHNTEQRKLATSDFQKNLWKLKNNACFGKSIEQVRKRRDVTFTKHGAKFKKLVRSPLFHSFDVFDHGLVCVERKKSKVVLNRPVYAGQVVLDVSKEVMYDFHFNCMKKKYGDNIKVCGTDTDSLIYEIKTNDVYEDISQMSEYFDLSDYPKEHWLHSEENKKIPGKFKDEMNGVPIKAFSGLRPKLYSFLRGDSHEKCVGKGIPRAALKSQLNYDDYKNCLANMNVKYVQFSKISTDRKHHLFTTSSSKKGLSCFDDKRYILGDNVNTLGYGHFRIENRTLPDEEGENLQELLLMMDEEEGEEEEEAMLID